MKTTRLKISGMKCSSCAAHVEKALKAVAGVKEVTVSLDRETVVEHEDVASQTLLNAVASAGSSYRGEVV